MNKKVKFKYFSFIVVLFIIVITYYLFWAPSKLENARIVKISKGMSFNQVTDSLRAAGVIRSKFFFKIVGKLLGAEKRIRVGKYLFIKGMSNLDIVNDLVKGKSLLLLPVTIREGLKASKIASILVTEVGIDSIAFMNLVFDKNFAQRLGIPASSLEGYLMPDTYSFFWQMDEEEIITRLVQQFWKVYNDSLQRRAENLGYTMNEVITMASIVEAETDIAEERPIIAGVYYNRLKKKMALQADPTIQYVLPDGPRPLKYNDLKLDSPYNTYLYSGLSPGPINNPGRDAIIAALYPAEHSYLYFVATGNGGHTFSKNYADHQRAVRNFRKVREQNVNATN